MAILSWPQCVNSLSPGDDYQLAIIDWSKGLLSIQLQTITETNTELLAFVPWMINLMKFFKQNAKKKNQENALQNVE